jgi:dephospho-CoA kinase
MRARRRAHRLKPRIIALTGSIAMGKSTAAAMLRGLGVPVFDSDAAARRLTAPGGAAIAAVAAAFPGAVAGTTLNRAALADIVFRDPAALRALERILHPMIRRARGAWMAREMRRGRRLVVTDVPLLFETGAERGCHEVWVATAPAFLQRQRALARPGMTAVRLANVLARQVPDATKRRRADRVLPTGMGRRETLRRIKAGLRLARGRRREPDA